MTLDEYLLEDGKVLAKAKANPLEENYLYATNQRVIRYKKTTGSNEEIDSLYYSHIVAVSLENMNLIWVVLAGTMFAVFGGFMLFVLPELGLLPPPWPLQIVFWLALIGGIILILIGLFSKPQTYQIKALGLSDKEKLSWRIFVMKNPEVKAFVRFVQEQINKREITVSISNTASPLQPVAKETSEVPQELKQKFPFCGKCGAKNIATDKFFTSCGKAFVEIPTAPPSSPTGSPPPSTEPIPAQTGKKEAVTKKRAKKKRITQVKCEYCGDLIPETASHCPACGIRRRVWWTKDMPVKKDSS